MTSQLSSPVFQLYCWLKKSIYCFFAFLLFTPTVGLTADYSVETPASREHKEGTAATLTAIPATGYKVAAWTGREIGMERWSTIFNSSIDGYAGFFSGIDFLSDDTILTAGKESDVAGPNWAGMGIRYNAENGTPLDDPAEWIRFTTSGGTLFSAQTVGANGDIYFIGSEWSGNTGAVWKYGADGNKAAGWPRFTPNLSFLYDVAVDSGGNVYAVGAHAVPYNWENNYRNWAIYKYKSDGTVAAGFPLPYYDHGHSLYDLAYRVAVDSEDNFIVAGMVTQHPAPAPDHQDWLIRKYTSSGTMVWEKIIDGKGLNDFPRGILIDSDDNVIVSGNINNGTDNSTGAQHDAYIIKFAKSDGDMIWEQLWDSGSSDLAEEMVSDSEGNFYVAGRTLDADDLWYPTVQYREGTTGDLLKSQALPKVTTHNNSPLTESYGGVYIDLRDGRLAVASYVYDTSDPAPTTYRYTGYVVLLDLLSHRTFPWTMFMPVMTGMGTE